MDNGSRKQVHSIIPKTSPQSLLTYILKKIAVQYYTLDSKIPAAGHLAIYHIIVEEDTVGITTDQIIMTTMKQTISKNNRAYYSNRKYRGRSIFRKPTNCPNFVRHYDKSTVQGQRSPNWSFGENVKF